MGTQVPLYLPPFPLLWIHPILCYILPATGSLVLHCEHSAHPQLLIIKTKTESFKILKEKLYTEKISFFFSVASSLKRLRKDLYCQFNEKEFSNPLPIDKDLLPEIFILWRLIVTKEAHFYMCTHVHTYVFIYTVINIQTRCISSPCSLK